MAALDRSAAAGGQIALPLTTGADEIVLLKDKIRCGTWNLAF